MSQPLRRAGVTAALSVSLMCLTAEGAVASVTVFVPGGGGTAEYRSNINVMFVNDPTCGDGHTTAQWKWTFPSEPDGPVRSFSDITCDSGSGSSTLLYPPSSADGIKVRVCQTATEDNCSSFALTGK